jgi:hypothetical protein
VRIALLLVAATLMLASCGKSSPDPALAETGDPTEGLPARFKEQKPVPKPDFSDAGRSPEFQQAVKDAAVLFGAQPHALRAESDDREVKAGVGFDVPSNTLERILRKAHTDFLARGFYLFRYDQNFNLQNLPDKVGLLPTTDPYAVMALMDTNGDNYNIGIDGVIAWMKELQQEQTFILTGIGFDYMEGYLTSPAKDPDALAKRMYQFCPDIVDQGVGTVSALARELRTGTLYFWWD